MENQICHQFILQPDGKGTSDKTAEKSEYFKFGKLLQAATPPNEYHENVE